MEIKYLTFLGRLTRAVIKGGNTRILTPLYDPPKVASEDPVFSSLG